MRSIVLLFGLFVVLTLSSCSNEDNPASADESESIEKLNRRTVELFERGTGVVEAADTIKKEFTYEDKILLKSLYNAGYSPADVTKAIHIAYDYNPRLAEPVLAEIMQNRTIADIAELILKEYVTELKSHPDDLKFFIDTVAGLENKVIILKENYEKEPVYILTLLRNLGEDVTGVVRLLINYFPLAEEDVKSLMLQADCTSEEIAVVLKSVYDSAAPEVLHFLYENEYQLTEILNVLKNLYYLSIVQTAQLLEGLNYDVPETAAVLQDLQYTNTEIAVLLKNHYNYSAEQTASLLKELNVSAEEITDILMDVYNLTVPETVVILYNIGFSVDEIIIVLRDHLTMGVQEIIDLLTYLGFDPCIVLQFFNIPC